ncbi:hypothetical protein XFF6991_430075 [Xanthomonas phaseoli pv. phaseoli]|uniref:Uncharacterized protein n=1 Tax=Xanthomonas campestris pv. phaseoli TaxID=317013 RepID=A0A7Z7NJ32_XANCH|nr:hypothetical protein XFF6991_430075 [Xanthomonas phaseoli pv. phaseoli]
MTWSFKTEPARFTFKIWSKRPTTIMKSCDGFADPELAIQNLYPWPHQRGCSPRRSMTS